MELRQIPPEVTLFDLKDASAPLFVTDIGDGRIAIKRASGDNEVIELGTPQQFRSLAAQLVSVAMTAERQLRTKEIQR